MNRFELLKIASYRKELEGLLTDLENTLEFGREGEDIVGRVEEQYDTLYSIIVSLDNFIGDYREGEGIID